MVVFSSFADTEELGRAIAEAASPSQAAAAEARARQNELTKPPGSLGRLEELACWLAGWQRASRPRLDRVHILIFAGNHGVCAQGVSPYPASVTAQMVANFERGGAAINQLAHVYDASLAVIPLDLPTPTADFTSQAAMTPGELHAAMERGAAAIPAETDLVLLGEMGIGNSTVAAALASALFGGPAELWVGPGTGHDAAGVRRKAAVVEAGLRRHRDHLNDPLEVLRRLGGREQAAIVGALLETRHRSIPVLLDGFICCAAAAVVAKIAPAALDHCLAAHCSAEPGHDRLLAELGKTPLLSLDMCLGEGTGAAMALGILRGAIACHSGMATFAEAAVDKRDCSA